MAAQYVIWAIKGLLVYDFGAYVWTVVVLEDFEIGAIYPKTVVAVPRTRIAGYFEKGLPYQNFGVYAYARKLHGAFKLSSEPSHRRNKGKHASFVFADCRYKEASGQFKHFLKHAN